MSLVVEPRDVVWPARQAANQFGVFTDHFFATKSLLLADAKYFLSGVSFKCDEFHLSAAYAILSCVVATSDVGLQLLLVLTAFDAFFVAELS